MKRIISIVLIFIMILAIPFSIKVNAVITDSNSNISEIIDSDISNIKQGLINDNDEVSENSYKNNPDDNDAEINSDEFNGNSDFTEPETENIPVEDIELSEFNEEMYVKDTQNLTATIIPSDATEQTVKYTSSDTSVATVSSTGKLTAVGKGTCRIYVTCENVTVNYDLKVKVKTESIKVKSKYIILKPNEQFNLEANVQPSDASQELKFKSKNESVAVVNSDSIITAKSIGSTSIIISNEDTTILVNVIVSTDSDNLTEELTTDKEKTQIEDIDTLTKMIKESEDKDIVVKGLKIIPSSSLKELYGTDKTLTVELDDYDVSIKGENIFNPSIELNTTLDFSETENGVYVTFSDNEKLPGTITVYLKNTSEKYSYFYLVDEENNNFQRINAISNNTFIINSVAKYLLSTKDKNGFKFNFLWILSGICVILILSVIYIFTKKKYWFW